MIKRDFSAITKESYDLIIVGGGIIGTGIARDAAMRGIKTLLLEKEDFAYGTTSRSSRLIHGGLRYLRQMEFGLVRQDMREREVLLHIAPHLVHPLPFIIPIARPMDHLALPLGMLLYDIISFDKSLPSCHRLSRRETLDREPGLESKNLAGSYLYYDCQAPFVERLCVENVLSATEYDALVLNHAEVVGLLRSGNGVCGVQVKDTISGEIHKAKTRIVLNAAGHWVDCIRGMFGDSPKQLIRRTKGIHLLAPQTSKNAVVCFARSDGRLFFVLPWQGCSLIGTTDTDYSGDLDSLYSESSDVAYLLPEIQRTFPNFKPEEIFYTTAGLRALASTGGKKASDVSRAHKLVDHEQKDGITGFVSILGGKITGYRAIAQEAIDLVGRKLKLKAHCHTASTPLPGAASVPATEIARNAQRSGLSVGTIQHLAELYGSRLSQVMELVYRNPEGKQQICPHCHDILAQIEHSVKEEGACTISDFLLRRSGIGLSSCQGLDAADTVAREMGSLLGWDTAEQQRQVEAYRVQA
ncbi:MAG: glycerol-3-phosphate dehydrogenase/oxidase, partial [Chloroflexi bacterium]|nr:glycerol-3-phosphate dehydrogenase/oxidase [Chloroflexota bacterium]